MNRSLAVTTHSPDDTRIVGAALAPVLLPGDVVSLNGDLGAGKTVLVQGIASALGVTHRVTSPTFTLVHEYDGNYPIVHLDVYRLDDFQQVLDLGFEELLDPSAILLVEWGEAVAPLFPRRYLEIDLRRGDRNGPPDDRIVRFRVHGPSWTPRLDSMRATAEALLNAAAADDEAGERFDYVEEPATRDHRGDPPDG
jgi:tRNA threonylcarbamoyladenosine biosynthesis protein TsaE